MIIDFDQDGYMTIFRRILLSYIGSIIALSVFLVYQFLFTDKGNIFAIGWFFMSIILITSNIRNWTLQNKLVRMSNRGIGTDGKTMVCRYVCMKDEHLEGTAIFERIADADSIEEQGDQVVVKCRPDSGRQ